MDKKRPVRTSAMRNAGLNGALNGQQGSSDDEEEHQAMVKPPPRVTRRLPKVDFSKLDATSLQKYRKHFKIGDLPASSSKEDLVSAISRHFASTAVDEEEILYTFAMALRKNFVQGRTGQHPGVKKPRNGAKPRGR